MAVTYGFYNSSNGDRKYNALQFSRLFEGIIRDGVFSTVGGSLMVVAASNLTVNISPGRAWFNNTWTNNDALLPLTLDPAEAILNRYDAIVLEVAPDERENRFKIVKGTPATTPAKPTMIKTGGIYQYPLAYIYVGKGVESISQANISNAVGTAECPFITGALQQVTTNDIIAQWESEFNTWFDNLQAQLEGNVVTNLQNQINTKLTADGGDGKDVVVSFTEAATEAHISSGEKLSVLFGKILKMFKGKAPNSHASSATTYGVGTTANYGHCKTINGLTQSSHVNGNALSAYQGKVLNDKAFNLLQTINIPVKKYTDSEIIATFSDFSDYCILLFKFNGNIQVTTDTTPGVAIRYTFESLGAIIDIAYPANDTTNVIINNTDVILIKGGNQLGGVGGIYGVSNMNYFTCLPNGDFANSKNIPKEIKVRLERSTSILSVTGSLNMNIYGLKL